MTQSENLLARINRQYPKLSKGQKHLANYIIEHYDKAVFLTAAKLGQEVGVSESTTVRAGRAGEKPAEFHSENGVYLRKSSSVGDSRYSPAV